MGKLIFQSAPRNDEGRTRSGNADNALLQCARAANPDPRQNADEDGPDRRQRAQQPLGITHTLIQMIGRQNLAVEPRHKISRRVEQWHGLRRHAVARHRNETEQRPVAHQRGDEHHRLALPARADQLQHHGDEVADADSLQHAIRTQRVEVKERKAVHDDAEQNQNDGPAKRARKDGRDAHAARQPRLCREHDGDADQQKERWEDQVSRREAIPDGVLQRPKGAFLVPVVVDENHEGERQAAQQIDREQA